MAEIADQFDALRRRIAGAAEPDAWPEEVARLAITPVGGVWDLDFHGNPWEEPYRDLLATLALPAVAASLRSLILRGPDEGANGTRAWELEPLLAGHATFDRLEILTIRQERPGDHNRPIIGVDYSEDGVLGRLLARMPRLRELTVPSAPGPNFFEVGPRPLQFLRVDVGYDSQDFIRHLAQSTTFGGLCGFEWGEPGDSNLETTRTTPDDFDALFRSATFASVRRFVWRNPSCSADTIRALKSLRTDLQLLVVRTSAESI